MPVAKPLFNYAESCLRNIGGIFHSGGFHSGGFCSARSENKKRKHKKLLV